MPHQPNADDLTKIGRDPDAFEAFYRAHIESVQRFIARRVSDPYLAADLTAEVFLAAIDSAHTYRPNRASPAAWLYGVARNVLAAERRRAARGLRAANLFAGRELLDADDLARIDERIDAEARSRQLYAAMSDLPGGERAVLELVALDGLTTAEAAAVLGVTATAARVRLHRARGRLRPVLAQAETTSSLRPSEARA